MTERTPKFSRFSSLAICVLVYGAALAVALSVVDLAPIGSRLLLILAADVVATLVVFVATVMFRNASLYDPFWSVAPVPIALYWLSTAPLTESFRPWVVSALVCFWALRLTANWVRGWPGLHHEDWRYRHLAQKTGRAYPLVNLTGIHLVPTLVVYLGCLPLAVTLTVDAPWSWVDTVASVVTLGAVLIEWIADGQMRAFRKSGPGPGQIMQTGFWSWCRHPNYLGEILFWVGLFLFAAGLDPWVHGWTGVGVVAMVLLFVFISIPMMDQRSLRRRPAYAAHMQKTNALIPRIL